MAVFVHTCPHCGALKMTFSTFGVFINGLIRSESSEVIVAAYCGSCKQGVILRGVAPRGVGLKSFDVANLRESGFGLMEVFPQPIEIIAPDFVPDPIASQFVQAEKALQAKLFDPAGMAFRRTLEVAVKTLDPDSKGTLQARIEALVEKQIVPKAVGDWAHVIRDLGNDATHEPQPFSEESATTLRNFAWAFLEYAFSMPRKVENWRASKISS